jgi:hypothetical protein
MTAFLGRVLCWAGFHKWGPWVYLFDCEDIRVCGRDGCLSNERREANCDSCPEDCK